MMQSRYSFANPILGVCLIFGLMSTTPSFQAHAQIAFVSDRTGNHEIYVMDAHGNKRRNLTRNPAHDYAPAWTPDGGRIAFTFNRDGNFEIYVMDAKGPNPRNLTKNRSLDEFASWSPSGERIAFCTDSDENREIYVMDANGGNPQR
ncbi:MAG: hypothetical protein OXN17_06950 [Candidatus Poribacteria bacterium]|nr:hypothetical protein [Candidatus Poribacteria bacterium]MDE0504387.1 hypothetical protein [Candidatus Poribacteria bacterium]